MKRSPVTRRLKNRVHSAQPAVARRSRFEVLEDRCVLAGAATVYHADAGSTGHNPLETTLTPANVNVNQFGKLFATNVDGEVYASPIYVDDVSIAGLGVRDVVYVATEHDSLYAIDAVSGAVLWQRSFINPGQGITTIPQVDVVSQDIQTEIGITSTPVVDSVTNTIYVVPRTKEIRGGATHYVTKLYAINLGSGADARAPAVIADTIYQNNAYTYVSGPSVVGTGEGNVGGRMYYNALRQHQRSALTMVGDTIFIASASHGLNGPYSGWILGYDKTSFALKAAFNTTPNDYWGGIWMAGGKISVDPQGYLYVAVGNGPFDQVLDAQGFPVDGAYGDSLLKLQVDPTTTSTNQHINGWGLKVVDYFVPYNEDYLDSVDLDLGSGGVVILPDSLGTPEHPHLLVIVGKEGKMYLIDRDNMGKFNPNVDRVVQTVPNVGENFSTPAYFNGRIYYVAGLDDRAQSFTIANGVITYENTTTLNSVYPGSTPSVSSNNGANGIVWILNRSPGDLRAYDASQGFSRLLWTSTQASGDRDLLGGPSKFTVPTVKDGRVYVGTRNQIVAYGLLQTQPPNSLAAPAFLTPTPISNSMVRLEWTDQTTGELGFEIERSTDGVNFVAAGVSNDTYLLVGGLSPSTTYYFRGRAYNSAGRSLYSTVTSVTTLASATGMLDYYAGFSATDGAVRYNSSASVISGALQLTSGTVASQKGSAFTSGALSVAKFETHFTFQVNDVSAPGADGFTFTIQGVGPTAIGPGGGGLGYGPQAPGANEVGIARSVAIKFDLFDNTLGAISHTGMYLNGASPTAAGTFDLAASGIDFHSGRIFETDITYSGTTLTVKITDTATGATATRTYTVNIGQVLNASTGYFGFTASTGGLTARQRILNWNIAGTVAAVPASPTFPTATAITGTSARLNWTNPTGSTATGILIERRTGATGAWVLLPTTLPSTTTSYVDNNLLAGTQYTYRLRAVNSAGRSPYSNSASITIPTPPTTPSNPTAAPTSTSVLLKWQDNSNNETGFRILRQQGTGGTYTTIAELPPNTTSFLDTGLQPSTFYDYHISAFNVSGFNDYTAVQATTLAAGFNAKINFSTSTGEAVAGYVVDAGLAYAARNGLTYGWNRNNNSNTRDRDSSRSPDERLDSLVQFPPQSPAFSWSIAVPNGTYQVTLAAGDATLTAGRIKLYLEAVVAIDGSMTSANRWLSNTVTVQVSDGQLTLTGDAVGAYNRINYIDIAPVSAAAASKKSSPSAASLTPPLTSTSTATSSATTAAVAKAAATDAVFASPSVSFAAPPQAKPAETPSNSLKAVSAKKKVVI